MSKPHRRLTTILLRLLSFLLLVSLARFFFLLITLSHPSPAAKTQPHLPEPLSLLHYSSVFRSLIADGYLLLGSKCLCITQTGQEVSALKLTGVPNSVGVKRIGLFRFKNDTFDFVFSSDLDRLSELGKPALEITRMIKPGGFFVVHTFSKDDYSLSSLLNLFDSFTFVRSREIKGRDSIREIILMKQNRKGTLVNKGSTDQGYTRNLFMKIEPLITDEPLKPLITFRKNLVNITYLSSVVDISFKNRYIYIDIGARSYRSSIGNWFVKQYPKQNKNFQIFAIEPNNIFHEGYQNKKRVTLVPYAAWMRNETLFYEIGHKQIKKNNEKGRGLGRAQSAQSSINFVNDFNKIEGFDLVNWLKGTFLLTDFVVLKMDVEGSEFHLIRKLVESDAICLVDELFVVCYYDRWKRRARYWRTYKECLEMFNSLRGIEVFVHQWWRMRK